MWGVGLCELVGKGAREWGGSCLGFWAKVGRWGLCLQGFTGKVAQMWGGSCGEMGECKGRMGGKVRRCGAGVGRER